MQPIAPRGSHRCEGYIDNEGVAHPHAPTKLLPGFKGMPWAYRCPVCNHRSHFQGPADDRAYRIKAGRKLDIPCADTNPRLMSKMEPDALVRQKIVGRPGYERWFRKGVKVADDVPAYKMDVGARRVA